MVNMQQDFGLSRTRTQPIGTPRTTRFQDIRCLTSLPAGRVVPICAIGLLREDALRRATIRISAEMMETTEILMNGVFVRVMAYFVSNLALDRFDGMDALNRSYQGVAVEGLSVVPFIEKAASPNIATGNMVLKYLGLHAKEGDMISTAHTESYNAIWNMRARNRSPDLNQRTRLQNDLAPAFWRHQQMKNVVASFDEALLDGEVALNVVGSKLPVTGIGFSGTATNVAGPTVRESTLASVVYPNASTVAIHARKTDASNSTAFPMIFAEMADMGITVSLSNIEQARKTQAFARIKEQYKGITDEYIIDLLMQGIHVPEQAMNQPILLADQSTLFGMSKRYSTDADAMDASVVNGATFIDLNIRMPQQNTGGMVMVTAEILPEQLFERQRDPFLFANHDPNDPDVQGFPNYLRDSLDSQKVDIVTNGQIDAQHATPAATFGYSPLSWRWMVQQPRIGGAFYRNNPSDTTNDEKRNRIWAVETINPTYAADFLISTNIHTKPFVVQNQDPFEMVSRGMAIIEGNTVFGPALVESTGSYEEVLGEAPEDIIDQPELLDEREPEHKPAPKPQSKQKAVAAKTSVPKVTAKPAKPAK